MAGEIQVDYQTAATLYAQVRTATGTVWNTSGLAFEAYLTANIADYDIAMSEQGAASGYYSGNFPALPAGVYNVVVKSRAGGGPAENDVTVAAGQLEWDGSAVVPLSSILSDTNELQTDWANGGRLDLLIDAIKSKTDALPAAPAATGDIPTVSQIWTTALVEAYRSVGAAGTPAQLLHEIIAHLGDSSISGTTKTINNRAGSAAKTYTLNSASAPTAIAEAS